MFRATFSLLVILSLVSCNYKNIEVDMIVHNAKVYTVDEEFSIAEAFAIKDGKVVELGAERAIMNKYRSENVIDAKKQFVYPGFIDAHCHFLYYGLGLTSADLVGTTSWNDVLERMQIFSLGTNEALLYGIGWDQNDWEVEEFPDNTRLNELFPDRPVILRRIDGHAVIVNDFALKMANIEVGQIVEGGIVELKNGKLTGILIDNAMDLIEEILAPYMNDDDIKNGLLKAQKNCFEVGITTVDDAGLDRSQIELIDAMQKEGSLKMRVYAMIADHPDNLDYYFSNGPVKTDRLNVRSVKVYADGALGSRGASLLEPYSDKPEEWGFLLASFDHYDSLAASCYKNGFQLNTHCIGDSANRYLTDVYAKVLGGTNDLRWRIEHAQIVTEIDIQKFKDFSIIPSIQPTHATSDMYWAEERLGMERMNEAYPYQSLLKANGLVALGTDFPVEDIDPLKTFYAAVARKDLKGYPEGSFLPEQKLSRKEALMGMTIWAALSNFEEMEKGSLELGKFADFVILEQDIMSVDEIHIPEIKVMATYVNGEVVYKRK